MTKIPERIIVTAQARCPAGVAVSLRFKMAEKNDYFFIVFLDSSGKAELKREEMLREFHKTQDSSPMDYINPLGGFSGKIEANVMTREAIERAIGAYHIFKPHWPYPPEYLTNLTNALDANHERKCLIRIQQFQ